MPCKSNTCTDTLKILRSEAEITHIFKFTRIDKIKGNSSRDLIQNSNLQKRGHSSTIERTGDVRHGAG